MSLSRTFIDRPIFATVLSVFVTLAGLGAVYLPSSAAAGGQVPLGAIVHIATRAGATASPIGSEVAGQPACERGQAGVVRHRCILCDFVRCLVRAAPNVAMSASAVGVGLSTVQIGPRQ